MHRQIRTHTYTYIYTYTHRCMLRGSRDCALSGSNERFTRMNDDQSLPCAAKKCFERNIEVVKGAYSSHVQCQCRIHSQRLLVGYRVTCRAPGLPRYKHTSMESPTWIKQHSSTWAFFDCGHVRIFRVYIGFVCICFPPIDNLSRFWVAALVPDICWAILGIVIS